MRKISVILVAVALLTAGNVLANNNTEPINPTQKLASQIHKVLESNSFNVKEDLTANVRFTINNEGEIVVLSVDTKDEILEGFLKGRLNYHKVEVANVKEGTMYTVPVRIRA
ncbi:MAG: hypothetical protein HKP24_12820 [Croceitalea sp.]|nr:hypothetical protein [Croceitalea sp.]NNM19439.1 hypothetical protein [Croceitalea sp.]